MEEFREMSFTRNSPTHIRPWSDSFFVWLFLCAASYLSRFLKLRNSEISQLKRLQIEAFKVMRFSEKRSQIWLLFRCRCSYLGGHTGSVVFYKILPYSQNRIIMAYNIRWAFETGSRKVSITTTWFAVQTSDREVMILWLSKHLVFHGWGSVIIEEFAKTRYQQTSWFLQRQISFAGRMMKFS